MRERTKSIEHAPEGSPDGSGRSTEDRKPVRRRQVSGTEGHHRRATSELVDDAIRRPEDSFGNGTDRHTAHTLFTKGVLALVSHFLSSLFFFFLILLFFSSEGRRGRKKGWVYVLIWGVSEQ
jgi:hypothetical protein